MLLCRETYVTETPEAARCEGALALQGFWYLSSLAAPPLPSPYSEARFKQLTTGRAWGGRSYDELTAVGDVLIDTIGAVLGVLWLLRSPITRMRALPDPVS